MSKEAMKLALDNLIAEYYMENSSFSKRVDDIFKEALVEQPAQPQQDYTWSTVADYENDVGFKVNQAFKMAWDMARTTNSVLNLTPQPAQRKPLGYAGIRIWGGDATVTKVFTETEMKFAREPRSLIEGVVGQLLDELAAHGIKGNA